MSLASRTRKRISMILLLAGLAGVGIWAWSIVRSALFERRANREFEELTRHPPVPPSTPTPGAPPYPKPGAVIGRLLIPRLHFRAIVREGTGAGILAVALGHVPGTALPGPDGNVAVAGHRDTLFRCLRNIQKDDEIVFQTTHGDYTYHVDQTKIVKPRDVAVLAPAAQPEITLVTCYPFYYVGAAPDRFIVHASLLGSDAAAAAPKPPPEPAAPPRKAPPRKLLARRKPPARNWIYTYRRSGF